MTIEFSYQALHLTELAAVHTLKASPHHRCYSWGTPGNPQEQSSQAFFMRFMFDRHAPAWMGPITLRATQRCVIPQTRDTAPLDLYIDDGQHRLVNLVLIARATQELALEALTPQAGRCLRDEEVIRLGNMVATPYLAAIAGMNVECRLAHEQIARTVHDIIDCAHAVALEAKAKLASINAKLEPTRRQFGVDCDDYKDLLASRLAAQRTLSDANENLVYNAYLKLRSELMGSGWSDFVNIAEGVVERLKVINFALVLCQPVPCSNPGGQSHSGLAQAPRRRTKSPRK